MNHNWLVSGLSAVDKGLHLYWGVRNMVQEDKDEASKIEDKKDLFVAKSSGHIESRTTENHN